MVEVQDLKGSDLGNWDAKPDSYYDHAKADHGAEVSMARYQ